MTPLAAMGFVWAAWLFAWAAAARFAAPTAARPAPRREGRAFALQGLGLLAFALGVPAQSAAHALPLLWQIEGAPAHLLVALAALGLCFAGWARIALGRLWSVRVTRKAHHRVVTTGPYALVRHPIYTGVLFALLATAVLFGTALAFLGFALFIIGFVMKARLEESFLRETLGEAYDTYARRVPMLIPFAPR
jgi:protein-S-isoprenylcysteine O-methyltransferase Ste14